MAGEEDKENLINASNVLTDEISNDNNVPQHEADSARKPRLMITQIVNDFFKSYAGRQVLGPFHKSFTSIVGPNGSGKSNVIDAMLFVFGYRSKKIRSKKLSLLIHNSSKFPNVESCSVAVHFQMIYDLPGDGYEAIPGSQFVVSRTARKDGSSDYYIDGKKSSFKEVGVLLRKSGIDLDHNRFLILQGEVEQISMMKPMAESEHDEGMLEYLEDIIGSSRFKEPLEQLMKEVEQLNELRGEKLNRVKAVEKEKDELEGAKDEALEYLKMENEIAKKRHILFQKYIFECSKNEGLGKEKRDEVQKLLDEIHNKLKEIAETKKEKGKEHRKVVKLHEKLSKEAEEKKRAFAEFEKIDLKLREDLKHRKENAKKIEKSLQKEKEKLAELKKVPQKSQDECERLAKAKTDLETQKKAEEEKLNEIMAGLKNETKGLQAEKENKEEQLLDRQKYVNEAKSKLDVAKSELELYQSQHKNLQTSLMTAQENIKTAEEKIAIQNDVMENLSVDVPATKKEIETKKTQIATMCKQEESLTSKVKGSRTKVEETKSALQASKSRSLVLSALLEEKSSGRLNGIYGRLGDLGAIDEKFDVAISTACGPLDFVVVDTMDTAQKSVEFLKKNNVGSTTFIALDKVEMWRKKASSKITTPENVPRLFDLVRAKDNKVLTAFYFALKDTLVASSLEQASRIAYGKDKRYRVVTEQGELIEQSGTMSGGGKKVAKGRMGCSFVHEAKLEDVEKLERALEQDVEELQALRTEKVSLEEELSSLEKDLKTKEHSLQKARMEKQFLQEQVKEQHERVKSLKEQVKEATPDPNHLAKLHKTANSFEKDFNKASAAASEIEKEVQKLHKKIMDIGGNKLKSQQMKLDSVNSLIDEVNASITKANVAIKSSQRNIKKSEDKVCCCEQECLENTEALKKLEEEFASLDEQATKVLEEHQAAQEKMQEIEEELNKVQTNCAEEDKHETELKSKEVDVKHEFEKYDNVVKENQQKIKHWQKELSRLCLHDVGDGKDGDEAEKETLQELTAEELENVDKEVVMYDITVAEEKLAQMKPNMAAIEEYRQKEKTYLNRVNELDKVTDERDSKRKEHDTMRKQRLDEFMTGFGIITNKLKEMYQMITLGGDAELELVDSLDPFSEGIVFSVRPPKKSWKNISKLSGGEKTLSSLALVFALHHYKPTPLYVMDEIDAALDFKNVSIVGNYIKERTKNAQFIIISLRNNMFELADRLVGIYKTSDCTKSVTINPTSIAVNG